MKGKNKNALVNFIAISDYAFVGENGKVGIIGIFDVLGVPSFPAGHPELFLVANIRGEVLSEHDVVVRLEDSTGRDLLAQKPLQLKIKLSGTGTGNLIQRFFNLTFSEPGLHKFIISIDGEQAGYAELSVLKINNGKIDTRGPN